MLVMDVMIHCMHIVSNGTEQVAQGLHHILHFTGDFQCQISGSAGGTPGDVAESGVMCGHTIHPIEQILDALQIRNPLLSDRASPAAYSERLQTI